MTNSGFFLESVPRPRCGAALSAAVGSWAQPGVFGSGAVQRHVAGTPSALPVASAARVERGQAVGGVTMTAVGTLGHQLTNRKPYIYMTRVNASGDGASGPHPEREPA